MSRPPDPLPEPLGFGPFRYGEARDAGLGRARLRKADVRRVHHGLYVPSGKAPRDVVERCEQLLPLLGPNRWFSHGTAARLHGMPLPSQPDGEDPLHVLSVAGVQRMRRPGVVGWESSTPAARGCVKGLLPIIEAAEVWCQLAVRGATAVGVTLTMEWLIAVGDFLLTGPRRGGARHPLCTREELAEAVARRAGTRGTRALARAISHLRAPVDSPKETQLRLGLIAAGLPEPSIQVPVMTSAGLRHGDLGYPEARLLLEYQGDEHRTSRKRWLEDLTRVQLLEDAGYRVMLVGADDDSESNSDSDGALDPTGFGPLPGPGLRALADRVGRALRGETFEPA